MIAKKHALILAILPIFLLSLIATTVPVQAPLPPPSVKVYVNQPLGHIPFETPGETFDIDFIIETNGIPENDLQGIRGWGMLVQIDPVILEIHELRFGMSSYFLWEFVHWYSHNPWWATARSVDPVTGEAILTELAMSGPGAGDPWSGLKLFTITVQSLNDTQPCLIDLVRGDYQTADGQLHSFDILSDGQYGHACMQLIRPIETWNMSKGLENSLISKLDNVIHLLDKGNTKGATHGLVAFINQVEALRDKKLTIEQADQLTSEAQRIIDLIEG